jgi:hypothetical protein
VHQWMTRDVWESRQPWWRFDRQFLEGPKAKNRVNHITDWIIAAVENDVPWTRSPKPDVLKKIAVLLEAYREANVALARIAERRNREILRRLKKDPVFIWEGVASPQSVQHYQDGFHIVELCTPAALAIEGKTMDHCIGGGGYEGKIRAWVPVLFPARRQRPPACHFGSAAGAGLYV